MSSAEEIVRRSASLFGARFRDARRSGPNWTQHLRRVEMEQRGDLGRPWCEWPCSLTGRRDRRSGRGPGVGVEEDEGAPSSATRYVAPSSACPATLLAKVTYAAASSTSRRHAEDRRGLGVILEAKPRTHLRNLQPRETWALVARSPPHQGDLRRRPNPEPWLVATGLSGQERWRLLAGSRSP